MFRWKTDVRHIGHERFFEPNPQAVLVAYGNQSNSRCRTDGGVRVRLQQTHTTRCKPVDVRRADIGTSVARHVRVSHVVGEDEDNVRAARRLSERPFHIHEGQRSQGGGTEHVPARNPVRCHGALLCRNAGSIRYARYFATASLSHSTPAPGRFGMIAWPLRTSIGSFRMGAAQSTYSS